MGVAAVKGHAQTAFTQAVDQGGAVFHRLILGLFEFGRLGKFEGGGQTSDGVNVGAALFAGEDGAVKFARQGQIGGEDAGAARAVEGLVGGEGDHMGEADRAGNGLGGDEAGDVRDIRQQVGAHGIGDGAEAGPIGNPGVRGIPGDDHLGLVLQGQGSDGVVINLFGDGIHIVVDDIVKFAGAVDG